MKKNTRKIRGHNRVWLSGYVGGKIVSGETRDGEAAYSFAIASTSTSNGHHRTWVRVNAYGYLAELCIENVGKGSYCSVVGELMNRAGKFGELTEVRIQDVVFFPDQKEGDE